MKKESSRKQWILKRTNYMLTKFRQHKPSTAIDSLHDFEKKITLALKQKITDLKSHSHDTILGAITERISELNSEENIKQIKENNIAIYKIIMNVLGSIKDVIGASYNTVREEIKKRRQSNYERNQDVPSRENEILYNITELLEKKKSSGKNLHTK